MLWKDPRMPPYASSAYCGEILGLSAFPESWNKSIPLRAEAKVSNRQVKCLSEGSRLSSAVSASWLFTGARDTAAMSWGRALLCNWCAWDSGIFLSDALGAPGNSSQGRSHSLVGALALGGDVRLGWQLASANTGCPSGLALFNTVQEAAVGHFCHPLKINPSITCAGLNSAVANLAYSEISSF